METDCHTVQSKIAANDDFLLLDCREQSEWDHVHIDGATLLPMSELQERVSELEVHRNRDIVVYCHHGGRSLHVANWLKQQGFRSVLSMAGGIDVWAQEIDSSLTRY